MKIIQNRTKYFRIRYMSIYRSNFLGQLLTQRKVRPPRGGGKNWPKTVSPWMTYGHDTGLFYHGDGTCYYFRGCGFELFWNHQWPTESQGGLYHKRRVLFWMLPRWKVGNLKDLGHFPWQSAYEIIIHSWTRTMSGIVYHWHVEWLPTSLHCTAMSCFPSIWPYIT